MLGILVVNHFLQTAKFSDLYARLKTAAESHGAELLLCTNRELMHTVGEPVKFDVRPDFVLFWDKDVLLARALEAMGLPVYNSAAAIEACDNKAIMHNRLAGLPMPRTILAPMTFPNIGYTDSSFLSNVGNTLGYPVVVKECFGSFGQQVYLARDITALRAIVEKSKGTPLLFQELIRESYGRDVRINVVGGRVCAAMLRESTNGDFRSNISLGGTAISYSPSDEERELALAACEWLGLDFAGVDLLFGANDTHLLCEVNSNPQFKSTLDYTGVDMAEEIIAYILKKVVKR